MAVHCGDLLLCVNLAEVKQCGHGQSRYFELEGHSRIKTRNSGHISKLEMFPSFLSWDEPLKTMQETTCCAPGVGFFFITSPLRCVHRPCRMARSKTPEESTKHTWHRLMCMLNPEGCQQIMLEHDLTMQTSSVSAFPSPSKEMQLAVMGWKVFLL